MSYEVDAWYDPSSIKIAPYAVDAYYDPSGIKTRQQPKIRSI